MRWRSAGCFGLLVAVTTASHVLVAGQLAQPAVAMPLLENGVLNAGGLTRSYAFYRPKVPGRGPLPTLIILHGAGGTGAILHRMFGAGGLADRAGLLLVYPDGLNRQWNDGRPASLRYLPLSQDVDDADFLVRLLQDLSARGLADAKRTYIVGVSNGAGMALRLACDRPELAAGFALIATPASRSMLDTCRSGRPKPILLIHGTNDRIIPYGGGAIQKAARDRLVSAPELAEFLAVRNGCGARGAPSQLPDAEPSDGTLVHRSSFTDCPRGGSVDLLTIEGGGHQPPIAGREAEMIGPIMAGARGYRSRDIDAAETAWQFFSRAAGRLSERR